jgi:hypothetical protein
MGALIPMTMVFALLQAQGVKIRPITRHDTTKTMLFFIAILPFYT